MEHPLLREKLSDLRLVDEKGIELPWVESLALTSSSSIAVENAEDDFKREMSFYDQALECVQKAKGLILNSGVKFHRPIDYFAEMVKSEQHMRKVKERLEQEETSIKKSEEAKKQRLLKKFGKKVQVEKIQQQALAKRSELEKLKGLKKKRSQMESDEFDIAVEDAVSLTEKRGPSSKTKRSAKDSKYGFGGKKKGSKRNTADSASDMSSFSRKTNGAIQKKKQANSRPGKNRRHMQKQKKAK